MGQPVVHIEVIGKDGDKLRSYYSELFGWEFGDPIGPTNYAVVQRDGNTNADGVGVGGAVLGRSCSGRNRSKLLHHPQRVPVSPGLDDLSTLDPVDPDAGYVGALPGRRHPG